MALTKKEVIDNAGGWVKITAPDGIAEYGQLQTFRTQEQVDGWLSDDAEDTALVQVEGHRKYTPVPKKLDWLDLAPDFKG